MANEGGYKWVQQPGGDIVASDGRARLTKRGRFWFLVLRSGEEAGLGRKATYTKAERLMAIMGAR